MASVPGRSSFSPAIEEVDMRPLFAAALLFFASPVLAGEPGQIVGIRFHCLTESAITELAAAAKKSQPLFKSTAENIVALGQCGFVDPQPVQLVRKIDDFLDFDNDPTETWEVRTASGMPAFILTAGSGKGS